MKLLNDGDLSRCANDRESYTVAETETYWVDIMPMIFNHRVVLTPKANTTGYDVGWCYPDLLAAIVAVLTWEPSEDQPEPVGFIKRVGELVEL